MGYDNDAPKWKGYIREALTPWETPFQTTQREYLDWACFILTCSLIIPLFIDSFDETAAIPHLRWMTPLGKSILLPQAFTLSDRRSLYHSHTCCGDSGLLRCLSFRSNHVET
jgi:hypothetical protein